MFHLELCEKHNLKMHSGSSSWSSAGQTSRWCPYHILMSSVIYYWTDPVVTWNLFFNLLRLGEMGDSSLWTMTTIINFHFIFEKEREMFPRIIRVYSFQILYLLGYIEIYHPSYNHLVWGDYSKIQCNPQPIRVCTSLQSPKKLY